MQILTGRQIYKQYKEYNQKELSLCGWVRSNRDSRDFGFLVINDGTFYTVYKSVSLLKSALLCFSS